MRRFRLHFTFGAALLLLAASGAQALGFGRGVTSTTLGQALDFSAQLASDGDESPALECVAAEVLIGDARVAPENVRATIENGRAPGDRHVRVTTRTRVDEPVVTVDVTVGCGSRMSRRFVAFVDPPMLHLATAEQQDYTPQRVDPQVAPLLDIVNAADPRRSGAAERRTARSTDARAAAGARAAPGRRLAGASTLQREGSQVARVADERRPRSELHASAARAARTGPRLQLDAPLPLSLLAAPAAASAPPSTSDVATEVASAAIGAAASSVGSDAPGDPAATLAAERARIEGLEASLARLHDETQAQLKTLVAVQARLRQAESERYANGLVYLLAIALVFVAVVAGAFWALRPRQLAKARWFEAQARQLQRSAHAQVPVEAEPPGPRVSQPPSGWNEGPQSMLPVTAPASIGGLEVTTVLAPQSHYARLAQQDASANSPLGAAYGGASSIDELADLEQQAEFFAVLGQDDAAVALLDGHLRRQAATSPLPYLHLLDLHRRRGHRGAFERARIDHGARFAALAPEWDASPDGGHALEDHAQTIAGLQALWATPPEAMRMLERLVVRPSANDAAFDLATYRELLLLYSVARDLATPVEADNGSIDLYLPLDDAPTVPLPREAVGSALDLDVSGWPDMPEEELVIRRSAGRRTG